MSESCLPPKGEHGLLLPPEEIDCIGESCHVAEKNGACFTSTHHYYWTEDYFKSNSLLKAFAKHRFNTRSMARCRHDEWHDQYDKAIVPRPRLIRPENRVMRRFLKEACFLTMVGISIHKVEQYGETDEFDATELVLSNLIRIEDAVNRDKQIEVVYHDIAAPIMNKAVELLEAS